MILKKEMTDSERIYRNYKMKKYSGKEKFLTGDMYKYYKKHRIYGKNIDMTLANKIFFEFNKTISKQIVYNNMEFWMPAMLGTIKIIRREMPPTILLDNGKVTRYKYQWVNYNETKKLWERDPEAKKARKKIYVNFGENMDAYYRWTWSRSAYSIQNKYNYTFVPTRANKKMIYNAVTSDTYNIDYLKK